MLNFLCKVKPLTNSSKIEEAEICYKFSIKSNEFCYSVMNDNLLNMNSGLIIEIDKDLRMF